MFYRIIFKIKNEFRYFRGSKCEFEFFNFLFPNVFTLANDIIFLFINPFFNNRLCVVCNNKFTPAFIWMLIFRGNNLNLIAAMQYGIEWNNLAVYFCTDTMKSNFTMNFERKINWRGVNRQTFQIAFRCKYINFILIKIKSETFQKVLTSFIFRGIFKDIPDPINPILKIFFRGSLIFFIPPMSCNTFFSNLVHFKRSDLDFNKPSIRTNNGSMN